MCFNQTATSRGLRICRCAYPKKYGDAMAARRPMALFSTEHGNQNIRKG
jgi:hypothetical protein